VVVVMGLALAECVDKAPDQGRRERSWIGAVAGGIRRQRKREILFF
jgi:hypothetical protein